MNLIKLALLLILTSTILSYGMSGDRGGTGSGIPRGPYVPELPLLAGEVQTDPEIVKLLQEIAWERIKTQLEQELKRITVKEEDAQKHAEEWFSSYLPQIEDTLFRRDSNLVNTIAQRFFEREITLNQLNETSRRSPYTVRLRVRARDDQKITGEQIQLIGQRFPNLRELDLADTGLSYDALKALANQPFARNLTRLDISKNNITKAGLKLIRNFTNLKGLTIVGPFNPIDPKRRRLDDAGLAVA